MRIEEASHRRRLMFVCMECYLAPKESTSRKQLRLARERTLRDWGVVSTPVNRSSLRGGEMPEQYASTAREAVRAFWDAGFEVATVRGVDDSTLNSAIATLGLQESLYAETRSGETVLRRFA